MLSWLKRLFGKKDEAPVSAARVVPSPAPVSAPVAAAAPAAAPAVSAAAPRNLCPAELVDGAAAQALAHFHANRPGPESFPGHPTRILDALQERDPDFNKLVRIIGQDAAIAARLLQVANSAFYATAEEAQSVRAAAMRIGLRQVGQIAMGFAGRSLFDADARSQYDLFP